MSQERTSAAHAADDIPHDVKTAGYELRDAQTKPIWIFMVGIFALLTLTMFGMMFVLELMKDQDVPRSQRHPMAADRQVPPAPQILRAESPLPGSIHAAEIEEYRAEMDHLTTTYGWVDPTSGVIRIPVERAVELTLERGLPHRDESTSEGAGQR